MEAFNFAKFLKDHPLPAPTDSLPESILSELQRLEAGLKQLDSQTQAAEALERELMATVAGLVAASKPQKALPETSGLALRLVEFPCTPLFVKRRFNVSFKLVGTEMCEDGLYPLLCALSVRKMDAEGAEIVKSRRGKDYTGSAYLKGQVTGIFPAVPIMTFHDLVFTDISSLFPQGRVNIFIHCPANPRVKQLMIEGVRVKARKKRPDEVL